MLFFGLITSQQGISCINPITVVAALSGDAREREWEHAGSVECDATKPALIRYLTNDLNYIQNVNENLAGSI